MSTAAVYPKLNEGVSQTAEREKKNPLSPNELRLKAIFEKTFEKLSEDHQINVRFIKRVRIFAFVAAPLSFLGTIAVSSPLAKVALVISGIIFAIIIWACPIVIRTENRISNYEKLLHKINSIEHRFTEISFLVSKKPIGAELSLDDFPSNHDSALELSDDIAHEIIEKISSISKLCGEISGKNSELDQILGQLNYCINQIEDTERTQSIFQAKGSLHLLKELLELVEDRIMTMKQGCTKAYFDLLNRQN